MESGRSLPCTYNKSPCLSRRVDGDTRVDFPKQRLFNHCRLKEIMTQCPHLPITTCLAPQSTAMP